MDGSISTWLLGLVAAFFGIKWQTSAKENQDLKQRLSQKKKSFIQVSLNFTWRYLT